MNLSDISPKWKAENGVVKPVNPYENGPFDFGHDKAHNQFEETAKQHTYATDLKDGEYDAEILNEIWQYMISGYKWKTLKDKSGLIGIETYEQWAQYAKGLGEVTRIFITLKHPSTKVEVELNEPIKVNCLHAICPSCGEDVDVIPSDNTYVINSKSKHPSTTCENSVGGCEKVFLTKEQYANLDSVEKTFYKSEIVEFNQEGWANGTVRQRVYVRKSINEIAKENADSIEETPYGFTITDVRSIAKNFFVSGHASRDTEVSALKERVSQLEKQLELRDIEIKSNEEYQRRLLNDLNK